MNKLTRKTAIEAKCWDCTGYYADGKIDCRVTKCPLYEFMPYKEYEADTWWLGYHIKRVGKILLENIKPTERQIEARDKAKERLKKMRKN